MPDLGRLFRLASLAPDAPPAPAMTAVLRAITIRRSRAQVRAAGLLPMQMRFPTRAAPHTVRFAPDTAFQHAFDQAILTIETLHLAPYCLDQYGLRDTPAGAAPLLRLILAKRLESGTAAFRQSLTHLARRLTDFREALDRGFLRPPGSSTGSNDNADQLLLEELLFQPLPPGLHRLRVASDTDADIQQLHTLATRLDTIDDPKAAALEHLLFNTLARHRVLVFTEFRDTATFLAHRFRRYGGVAAIHGSAAWLGTNAATRSEVIRRFAPHANQAPEPPPHQAVRILIATDVLSEGLNLQDAAHVVSYDLPWNPVRLIQRVGRIDRLNSPHQLVHSHHFLPAAGLESLLGLVQRLRQKLAAIRAGLATQPHSAAPADRPADNPASTTENPDDPDTPGVLERLANGDPTLLDDLERLDTEPLESDDPLRQLWLQLPTSAEPATPPPSPTDHRTAVIVARLHTDMTPPDTAATALVALHRDGRVLLITTRDGARPATAAQLPATAATLRLAIGARLRCGSISPAIGKGVRARVERCLREAARAATAACHDPLQSRTTGPATRTLRQLRLAAAATPGGPTADLCHRIDRITRTLAHGLRSGHEAALARLLSQWRREPPADAQTLCSLVEAALRHDDLIQPPARSPDGQPPRPFAIILLE